MATALLLFPKMKTRRAVRGNTRIYTQYSAEEIRQKHFAKCWSDW